MGKGKSNEIDLLVFFFLPFYYRFLLPFKSLSVALFHFISLCVLFFFNIFYTANHILLQPKVLVCVNSSLVSSASFITGINGGQNYEFHFNIDSLLTLFSTNSETEVHRDILGSEIFEHKFF